MKKLLLSFFLSIHFAFLYGAAEDQNLEALKEWIATKRALTLDERGGSLSISGDIRVEYYTLSEQKNGIKNLGPDSLHPLIPQDQFDIELNLMFDFQTDLTWASAKLEFDNNMGTYNGNFDSLYLERAFFGLRIFETEMSNAELEFGRRIIGYTFDSQIQFNATMDGLLLKYYQSTNNYGDFYLYAAPFVVNEVASFFSFVIETGLLNICNTGFYAKYSIIDWDTKDFTNDRLDRMHQFLNSQFILGYRFDNPFFNAVTVLYGAFLINTAASNYEILNYRKDNLAGYAGISMGEIRKKNDWSFDLNFQLVQPQAIPYVDFSGIGIDNPDNYGLYFIVPDGTGLEVISETAVSNSNFWGFKASFLYAIDDTITLSQGFSFSRPLMHLHNKFNYQSYKLALIYAW